MSEPALQYLTVLRDLLDLNAPQRRRYVTLPPHASWRRLERKWHSTVLKVDRQLYRDHFAVYHRLLTDAKTSYHNNKLKPLIRKLCLRKWKSWLMVRGLRSFLQTSTKMFFHLLLPTISRPKLINLGTLLQLLIVGF